MADESYVHFYYFCLQLSLTVAARGCIGLRELILMIIIVSIYCLYIELKLFRNFVAIDSDNCTVYKKQIALLTVRSDILVQEELFFYFDMKLFLCCYIYKLKNISKILQPKKRLQYLYRDKNFLIFSKIDFKKKPS